MSQRDPFDRRGGFQGGRDQGDDEEEEQSQGSALSRLNPFARRQDNPPKQPPQSGRGGQQSGGRGGQQEDQGGGLLGGIRARLPFGGGGGQQGGQQRQQGGGQQGRPPAGGGRQDQQTDQGGGILGGIRSRLPFGGGQKQDDPAPRGGQPPRPGTQPFPGAQGGSRPGGGPGGPQSPQRPGGLGGAPAGGAPRPGGGSPFLGSSSPGGQRPGAPGASQGGFPRQGAPRQGGFPGSGDDDLDDDFDSGGQRPGGLPGGAPRPGGGFPGGQQSGGQRPGGGFPGAQPGGSGAPRPGGLPGAGPGSPSRPSGLPGQPGGGQPGGQRPGGPGGLPGSQPGGSGGQRPSGLPGAGQSAGPGSPGRPGGLPGQPGSGQPGGQRPGGPGGLPGSQPGGSGAPRPGGLPGSGPGSPGRPSGGLPGQSGGAPGGGLPGGQPSGARPGGLPGGQPGGTPPGGGPRPGGGLPGGQPSGGRPGGLPGSGPGSPSRPGGFGTQGGGPSSSLGAAALPGGLGAPGRAQPGAGGLGPPPARGAGSPTKAAGRGGRAGGGVGTRPRAPEAEPLLSLDTKLDIVGIVLIVVALVTVLSLFSTPGSIIAFWLTFIRQTFGWGSYVVPVVIGGAGVWLIWRHFGNQLPLPHPLRVAGALILAIGTLTFIHAVTTALAPVGQVYINPALADPTYPGYTVNLVWERAEACPASPDDLIAQGWITKNLTWNSYQVARCGYGGGLIGYFFQKTMADLLGDLVVFVVSLVAIGTGVLLTAQMTLKDAMLKSRDEVQRFRDRRAGITQGTATAYQRDEKGNLVPMKPAGTGEAVAEPRGKPAPAGPPVEKKEEKPTVASGPGSSPTAPPTGRPSIVTGMGPGSSPTAPPKPAPGALPGAAPPPPIPSGGPAPTASPAPGGASGPAAPRPPGGLPSPAPSPLPAGTPPPAGLGSSGTRPVLPGSPSRTSTGTLPPLPGGGGPGLSVPPRPGGLPGGPATPPPVPGGPPKPAEESASSASLPGAPRTGGLPGGAPAPRPAAPPAEQSDDMDEDDDDGNPGGPGTGLSTPPRPAPSGASASSTVPPARPQPGQPSTAAPIPGGLPPRPSAPPRPGGTPGQGPGTQSGRTFGPGMPGSISGTGSLPKPPAAVPASKPQVDDDSSLDSLRPKASTPASILGDDALPSSDEIIKDLVSEGEPVGNEPAAKAAPPPAARPPSPPPAKSADEQAERPRPTPPPAPSAAPPPPRPAPSAAPTQAAPSAVKPPPPTIKASAPTASTPPKIESEPKTEGGSKWDLPSSDTLQISVQKSISDDELRQRAMLIEQTLSSFGAPGRVVEVNHGPVITQFGVEPDYIDARAGKRIKVKVGKISALADDLALALAAPSIRIEAPVPGKGYVGVEVPNAQSSVVGLRDVTETPEFRNMKSPLKLALGQDVSGQPIVADMTSMPHLLIAGTTGSGKSVCVNGIIATMLMNCTPDELKLIMVDPKRVELTNYNGIPHLMAPVVTELERIVGVLKWVQREMDDRYRRFAMEGARNINDFNGRVVRGAIKADKLPYILVIVDELADLMMLAPDETERVITRLAQMARATGIHIIISTQRPSVDVVTGLIKANFPARIAFAVATGVDSRVILDMPGAEKLLGRGDMLFQAPDAPMPIRMQGIFVADKEIQKIVDHWKDQATAKGHVAAPLNLSASATTFSPSEPSSGVPAVQRRLFEGGEDGNSDDADDLFDEAVELVRGMEKASISLLQRHLRIGYTRAARLIDLMEERAVIGPHEGGSKPRVVLGPDGKPLRDLDDEEDDELEGDASPKE